MLYRTHIASSLTLGTSVAVVSGYPYTVGFIAGVVLGSLLPDIDEPKSFIGQRSFELSKLIKKRFGHRGITHSLLCWIVVSSICLIFPIPFTLGISLGYLFHLLGDLFSVNGIPLFAPIRKEKIKMCIRYKTGGVLEQVIFSVSILLFLYLIFKDNRLITDLGQSLGELFTEIMTIIKSVLTLM